MGCATTPLACCLFEATCCLFEAGVIGKRNFSKRNCFLMSFAPFGRYRPGGPFGRYRFRALPTSGIYIYIYDQTSSQFLAVRLFPFLWLSISLTMHVRRLEGLVWSTVTAFESKRSVSGVIISLLTSRLFTERLQAYLS